MSIQGRIALSTESVFYFRLRIYRKMPIFISERYFHILTSALENVHKTLKVLLLGYVIVDDELSVIISVHGVQTNVREAIQQIMSESAKHLLGILEKENRTDLLHIFKYNRVRIRRKTPRVWEPSNRLTLIRTEKTFMKTLQAIHQIPVKLGLVTRSEHWRFSSARNYLLNDHSVLAVATQFIG